MFICSNDPARVSVCAAACPANKSPNTSTAFPAFISSAVNSLNCGTSSPNSPDNPENVLDTFLIADSNDIPVAAERSNATGIISFICSSVNSKEARNACCAMIASSPNVVTLCKALA